MKLTSFLLLAICLHISGKTVSQTITLSGRQVPLEKVFSAIKEQTGYVVFYNRQLLVHSKPVTVKADHMPLPEFLQAVLHDQSLDYIIDGKTITLSERKDAPMPVEKVPLTAPAGVPVMGTVRSASGQPLEGVSIRIKGRAAGAKTNAAGRFSLMADEGDIILVSHLGYLDVSLRVTANGTAEVIAADRKPREENIPGPDVSLLTGNQLKNLSILLTPSATSLQTVTVNKGYYTTTQRFNTGNVAIVSHEDIEKQPVANLLQALQGRVPGLIITQQSGVPGSNFTVQIRGQNSILNGNTPLYIVDGIPYSSDNLNQVLAGVTGPGGDGSGAGSAAGLGGLSPLNNINPANLESIEILKDADATAIYGSRGANGVIIINTKKAVAGPLTINANLNYGTNFPTRFAKYMNTQEYLHMRDQAFVNDGTKPGTQDFDVNGTWDRDKYTDWTKSLVGHQSSTVNAQANISGGTAQVRYMLGADYSRQNPPYGGNFSDNRGGVHLNLNTTSVNKKFNMGITTMYSVDDNTLPGMDQYANVGIPPNTPDMKAPDGSLIWTAGVDDPFANLMRPYNARTQNLMANLMLNYKVIEGLNIKTSLGYNTTQFRESRLNPAASFNPLNSNKVQANANFGENGGNSWIFEPMAEYVKKVLGGNLHVLAGATMQSNINEGQVITGVFQSDAFLNNINAAISKTITSSYSKYSYAAAYGRISYEYADRYVVNLTGRRDGSSRFGPGRQVANFGAVGAGWIFSETKLFRDYLPFVSFGKLRSSYGITGSDQVANYRYLDSYTPIATYSYQGLNGLVPSRLYNADFGWESNRKLEAATELGFLHDRINLSVSWFKNRSSSQLVNVPLSPATGNTDVQANLPALVQNTGWEFTLTSTNIKRPHFSWKTNFNLTISRNKLISFPDLDQSSYKNQYVVGQPVTILKLFKYAGVDPTTGIYQFMKKDGTLTSSPAYGGDDQYIIFNANPAFYGGMQNSFTYKGISLDIFIQFTKQQGKNLLSGWPNQVGSMHNLPRAFIDAWQKPGDEKALQRYTAGYTVAAAAQTAASNSDQGFTDASYIRCKNVAISYQLEPKWTKKIGIQSARVYAQAQNLLTFTNYAGADPETQGLVLPPMKTITGGISFNF